MEQRFWALLKMHYSAYIKVPTLDRVRDYGEAIYTPEYICPVITLFESLYVYIYIYIYVYIYIYIYIYVYIYIYIYIHIYM